MDARNMQRRELNKYIKQNCAPSWIYLRDCTGMHIQQNIECFVLLQEGKGSADVN